MMLWNNDSRSEGLRADYWLLKLENGNNYGKNYMIEDGGGDYDDEIIEDYVAVLNKMNCKRRRKENLTFSSSNDTCFIYLSGNKEAAADSGKVDWLLLIIVYYKENESQAGFKLVYYI